MTIYIDPWLLLASLLGVAVGFLYGYRRGIGSSDAYRHGYYAGKDAEIAQFQRDSSEYIELLGKRHLEEMDEYLRKG